MTIKQHVHLATTIAQLLDSQFSVLGFKFGLDGFIGMVPGIGDVITLFFSGYILWVAKEAQLPEKVLRRMTFNVALDAVMGLVPLVGDVGDILFKANERNIKLLVQHLPTETVAIEAED
jgi:hypothetical protein